MHWRQKQQSTSCNNYEFLLIKFVGSRDFYCVSFYVIFLAIFIKSLMEYWNVDVVTW